MISLPQQAPPLLNPWLSSRGSIRTKKDSREYTHTKFNGGTLAVSDEDYEDFLNYYAQDVLNGHIHCLHEQSYQPVHRFMMDLDLPIDQTLTEEQVIETLMVPIQKILVSFFPTANPNDLAVLVCTRPPTQEVHPSEPDKTCLRFGIHPYWPFLYLTDDQCLDIRESFLLWFQTHPRHCPLQNLKPWDDVLDRSIYDDHTGLRMLFSRKASKCQQCRAAPDRRKDCPAGCEYGYVVAEKPPYLPKCALDVSGQPHQQLIQMIRDDPRQSVILTALRRPTENSHSGFIRPLGAPAYTPARIKRGRKRKADDSLTDINQHTLPEDAKKLASFGDREIVPSDSIIFKRVEDFIQNHLRMAPIYNECWIDYLYRYKGGQVYRIRLGGRGSSYCQNIGRDHRNNNIYFYIHRGKIYQRCFCTCKTTDGRISGKPCSSYSSAGQPLTKQGKEVLFPEISSGISTESVEPTHVQKPPSDQFFKMEKTIAQRLYQQAYQQNRPYYSIPSTPYTKVQNSSSQAVPEIPPPTPHRQPSLGKCTRCSKDVDLEHELVNHFRRWQMPKPSDLSRQLEAELKEAIIAGDYSCEACLGNEC